jgi:hypothetical protein
LFYYKELPDTTKGRDFCLLIWNPVVCHGAGMLEFALMDAVKGFVTLVKEKSLMS